MTRDDVQRWLDDYVSAWRTYDPVAIGELFSADATYRYHAYDEPASPGGTRSLPTGWSRRMPRTHGRRTTSRSRSRATGRWRSARAEYRNPDGSFRTLYYNLWTLRFDADGRCADFVEYYNELPERLRAGR